MHTFRVSFSINRQPRHDRSPPFLPEKVHGSRRTEAQSSWTEAAKLAMFLSLHQASLGNQKLSPEASLSHSGLTLASLPWMSLESQCYLLLPDLHNKYLIGHKESGGEKAENRWAFLHNSLSRQAGNKACLKVKMWHCHVFRLWKIRVPVPVRRRGGAS